MTDDAPFRSALRQALSLASAGHAGQAEAALLHLHRQRPASLQTVLSLVRLLGQRGDWAGAEAALLRSQAVQPDNEMLAVELAGIHAQADVRKAAGGLQRFVAAAPDSPLAWLFLGQLLHDSGQAAAALQARFQALARAQASNAWLDRASTPPHLAPAVSAAVHAVRSGRREILHGVLQPLRDVHGRAALQRIDKALAGYLGDCVLTPPDAMQRPRFLYIPDLPTSPYLDPHLHGWAARLEDAFAAIRDEALSVIAERSQLQAFVDVKDGDELGNYLGGSKPAWDAFFFYRHGERFDANHERCPRTSAVLESLDLSRIPGQTPEVCFSVLAPGTHILPHHGVSNMRCVMHLPLRVPDDCALHLVDRGVHRWSEGRLVMFDDTFLHESWNRSDEIRVIVLMDCWNPHLTEPERAAAARLAHAVGIVDMGLNTSAWPDT